MNTNDLDLNETLVSNISDGDLPINFAKYETPYSITDLYIILHKANGYTNNYNESKYLI